MDEEVQLPAVGAAQGGVIDSLEGAAPPAVAGGVMPAGVAVTERLVVVPRDRRCPMFNGRTAIGIGGWMTLRRRICSYWSLTCQYHQPLQFQAYLYRGRLGMVTPFQLLEWFVHLYVALLAQGLDSILMSIIFLDLRV
ncbi:hypothetical protein CRENBAI_014109 [Crenichthys baileyi]|uniref:Uncharacterized protein n=1 Tax=Crenichthys baileyi TaxID=28760 RepID=A0AAV9RJV0_9TELE